MLGGVRVDVNREVIFFFVKNQNKIRGWSVRVGLGVRMDVNEELKFLRKFTKNSGGGGIKLKK